MHDRSQTAIEMVGITINFVIVGHGWMILVGIGRI
jgi:hypothetical protein